LSSCNLSKARSHSFLSSLWFALLVGLMVLGIDAFSKFWVHSNLPQSHLNPYAYPYGGIGIFKDFLGIEFSLTHATNRGAAWGTFADYHTLLLYVRLILVAGLIVYTFFFNTHPRWRLPLMLIIAGALGNILDFFIYDHVVDMFQFIFWGYHYPVFNIADSAIFIGIAWLFLLSWSDMHE
jgi:signal peptidase II